MPNVGPYIYDVSISGFTRSYIYIYIHDISSLRVNWHKTWWWPYMAETCCFDLTLKNIPLLYIIWVVFLTKQVIFDYILHIYFVILYNTVGIYHLKCPIYVVSFPGSIICTQLKLKLIIILMTGCVTCTDRIVVVWQISLCIIWWIKTNKHYLEVGGGTHSNSIGWMKIFRIWQDKHINANCNFPIMVVKQKKCIFTLMIK